MKGSKKMMYVKGDHIKVNGKRAVILSDSIFSRDHHGFIARALYYSDKIETVLIRWRFTPAYEIAIDTYSSADERDDTIMAIVNDYDGAAEWNNPEIIKYITPENGNMECYYTDKGQKRYFKKVGQP